MSDKLFEFEIQTTPFSGRWESVTASSQKVAEAKLKKQHTGNKHFHIIQWEEVATPATPSGP